MTAPERTGADQTRFDMFREVALAIGSHGLPTPETITLYATEMIVVLRCEAEDTQAVDAWALKLGLPAANHTRCAVPDANGKTWRSYGTSGRMLVFPHWSAAVSCDVRADPPEQLPHLDVIDEPLPAPLPVRGVSASARRAAGWYAEQDRTALLTQVAPDLAAPEGVR